MLTAGDKGGFSRAPDKDHGMDDPGPRCPKCGWGLSRVVKAEDRIVEVACINAGCNYLITHRPGGKVETLPNVPTVPGDDNSSVPTSLVRKVWDRL